MTTYISDEMKAFAKGYSDASGNNQNNICHYAVEDNIDYYLAGRAYFLSEDMRMKNGGAVQ